MKSLKALITASTLGFWAAVAATQVVAANSASPAASAPSSALTLKEVARHADAQSCWMAIDGQVYDFTTYLPRHPSAPSVMLKHCGTDATQAFADKGVGRPHSAYAKGLLKDYLKGPLVKAGQ